MKKLILLSLILSLASTLRISPVKRLPAQLEPSENSASLSEIELSKYLQFHHLSKSEISGIYKLLDKDKQNSVSPDEWADFYSLFVKEFESCDKENDYLLTASEFKDCLLSHSAGGFKLEKENLEALAANALSILGKQESDSINFAEFLFLRRIGLAWVHCSLKNQITITGLACGLNLVVPSEQIPPPIIKKVFELGIKLQKRYETFLELITFANLANVYNVYYLVTRPMGIEKVSSKDFRKAVERQLFPLEFNTINVDEMFELFNGRALDLISFSSMYSYYKLYSIHKGGRDELFLSLKAFESILNRPDFPTEILKLIDNFIPKDDERYGKALKDLLKRNHEDAEYFLASFLEKSHSIASKSESNSNRELVYKIFDSYSRSQFRFRDFLSFMRAAWAFFYFDPLRKGFITGEAVQQRMKTYEPELSFPLIENEAAQKILEIVGFTLIMNPKQFFDFCAIPTAFKFYSIPGTNDLISQPQFAIIRERLGLLCNDRSITNSLELGPTDTMLINSNLAFKNCMSEELKAFQMIQLYQQYG